MSQMELDFGDVTDIYLEDDILEFLFYDLDDDEPEGTNCD